MSDSPVSLAKKGGVPRFTTEQMIAGIQAKRGLVSAVSAYLRCDPETVRNYARRYPTVAAALREERERTLDVAEAALYQAISGGEGWAVCFTLKTLGKSRGYVERQELTGADGGPVQVQPVQVREVIVKLPSADAPLDP